MLILVCVFQAYGPPAAYGSGTAGPMDGYGNETPYFPFGHPSRQAPSSGPPKRKKEVPLSGQTFFSSLALIMLFYCCREVWQSTPQMEWI